MSVNGAKTWVEISRGAMENTIASLRSFLLPSSSFCAVVKANAYGHGLENVVTICCDTGIDHFAVDSIDEAMIVRSLDPKATIFILGYTVPERLHHVVEIDAIQTIYDPETVIAITKHAARFERPARVSVKVETGLYRQGATPRILENILESIGRAGDSIILEGVASHFASSEVPGSPMTPYQLRQFQSLLNIVDQYGFTPRYQHIACSAAGLLSPETQGTMTRFGIALYGLWPSKDAKRQMVLGRQNVELTPALSWKTRIAQIKDVPPGAAVGYGGTHVANRPLRLAVLPVGYYDGYDRALSNKGEVLIRGRRCPVIGNVCMNMIMVDVSAVPGVAVDDVVTLIGRDGMHAVTADDLALTIGTINYEVVTRINPLLPRVIV
jgi:alanine racemase